jgi:transposase InsO family protein
MSFPFAGPPVLPFNNSIEGALAKLSPVLSQLIAAIVELKRRNPRFGCVRIAQQISHAFGIEIHKDVVRRVLAKHYRPAPGADGPSWLSFIAQLKDSLWSVDLFRCESILLRRYWVMVIMDGFTRRLVGFGVERTYIDGVSVCRMFNHTVAVEIEEIKSVPYVSVSHPFVERLIGTIRREYLDQMLFWNALDLKRKLEEFLWYYNASRVHRSLARTTPAQRAGASLPASAALDRYGWRQCCRGLFQIPLAA